MSRADQHRLPLTPRLPMGPLQPFRRRVSRQQVGHHPFLPGGLRRSTPHTGTPTSTTQQAGRGVGSAQRPQPTGQPNGQLPQQRLAPLLLLHQPQAALCLWAGQRGRTLLLAMSTFTTWQQVRTDVATPFVKAFISSTSTDGVAVNPTVTGPSPLATDPAEVLLNVQVQSEAHCSGAGFRAAPASAPGYVRDIMGYAGGPALQLGSNTEVIAILGGEAVFCIMLC